MNDFAVTGEAPPGEYVEENTKLLEPSQRLKRGFIALGIATLVAVVITVSVVVAGNTDAAAFACDKDADIIFFLDESGSIEQIDYLNLLSNISEFVGKLDIGQDSVRVGVIESQTSRKILLLGTM